MNQTLRELIDHQTLSASGAQALFELAAQGELNPSELASILTVYCMRPIEIQELAGFRQAALSLCTALDLSEFDPIDMCGTGGDHKNTFNISTLAALVVAACGIKVAKHGNYGASSICGSSNVLEALGHRFRKEEDQLREDLEKANICFIHAPLYHPLMKSLAPIRKELGVRTFLNILGPLVNPCRPRRQLCGVSSLELLRCYAYLLQASAVDFCVVHSLDGYDEVSLTKELKAHTAHGEELLEPSDFGVRSCRSTDLLAGADIGAAARTFLQILSGEGTEQQNSIVAANAALALRLCKPEAALSELTHLALETLKSAKALNTFKLLV